YSAAGRLLSYDRRVPLSPRLSHWPHDRAPDRRANEESEEHWPGVRANGGDGTCHTRCLDEACDGLAGRSRSFALGDGKSVDPSVGWSAALDLSRFTCGHAMEAWSARRFVHH